jgi:hypothetical protein
MEEAFGMWKGQKRNLHELRQKAWGRRAKRDEMSEDKANKIVEILRVRDAKVRLRRILENLVSSLK